MPTVTFRGTVKLHGTNAAVCQSSEKTFCQSRARVIGIGNDNAGFAAWQHANKEMFANIFAHIRSKHVVDTDDVIQIYGEWCGGNIQKRVGLTKLPKMFVVFGIRISKNSESQVWFKDIEVMNVLSGFTNQTDFRVIFEFDTFYVTVDANNPELAQQFLATITLAVEERCPVAAALLPNETEPLIGEGIVWTAISTSDDRLNINGLMFKTKGEKHSVSKVKTVAAVDIEKVNSVNEFVEFAATENRFNQGIQKLIEAGIDTTTPKNTSEFIRWVMGDILKEEADTLCGNGLCAKDVTSKIASVARDFYLKNVK